MLGLFIKILLNIIVLTWGMFSSAHGMFILLILTWMNMMLYSYSKLSKRVMLFAFGVTFFVFLIGREFLEQYVHYERDDYFSEEVTIHTYLSMWIALVAVWGAFAIFSQKCKNEYLYQSSYLSSWHDYRIYKVKQYSKFIFFATLPFALLFNLIVAVFVAKTGYHAYYTDFSGLVALSPPLYLLSKIELMTSAAFCVFMATLPTKDEFSLPCKAYLVYILLTLGSGQRSGFLLGIMMLFVFVNFMQNMRPQEKWFNKKYMFYLIFAIPVVAILSSLFNVWRFGGTEDELDFVDVFFRFFYEQGVSAYIVKRAYEVESNIPGGVLYCLEFLHSGIPARLLGIEVYNGNTVEHALYGNSFTHALGYTVMGKGYLAGGGTGSSYIAELYYDFGYLGVAIGSFFYGWVFSRFTRGQSYSLFKRSLLFIVISQFLWAPRGAYTAFLSFLFAPSTVAMLLFIFGISYLSVYNCKKRLI